MTEKQTYYQGDDSDFMRTSAQKSRRRMTKSEGTDNKPNKGKRLRASGYAVLTAALGATGIGLEVHDMLTPPPDGHYGYESIAKDPNYTLDKTITELVFADGAIVRSATGTDKETFLDEYSAYNPDSPLPDLTVETPDGVFTITDANGEWFGLRSSDLQAALQKNGLGSSSHNFLNTSRDKDGIVWVNQQKATPNHTVIGDVATPTDNPSDPTNLAGLNN